MFHIYTVDGSVDDTVTIHDGDVYNVPEGYHGPTVAPPEYPMYFLNVLAGPGGGRMVAASATTQARPGAPVPHRDMSRAPPAAARAVVMLRGLTSASAPASHG